MGGKSGGGYDTGPMLEMGNNALSLQDKIYKENRQDVMPWYQTGKSALDMLGGYLGIPGTGGSAKSRDQLIAELTPKYTTSQNYNKNGDPISEAMAARHGRSRRDVVNQIGLDKAVNAALANQPTSDPEGFGSLMEEFSLDKFQADPGYQFRLDEQNKAIERAAAARGQYFDPSTVKALTEYGGNLADQTYGDAYNRYNNDQNNIFNRLAAMAGIGQTATGQMISSGQGYADQAGTIYGNMGNTITSANVAKANQPSMFDTLMKGGVSVLGGWAGSGFA